MDVVADAVYAVEGSRRLHWRPPGEEGGELFNRRRHGPRLAYARGRWSERTQGIASARRCERPVLGHGRGREPHLERLPIELVLNLGPLDVLEVAGELAPNVLATMTKSL